ncbi:MAG TPA: hypothetical protein VNN08_20820 [Thermoanaerobaculia bacterium]|nr:hypothetical protein [Thermoanaerobaculia bacterium]
MFPQATPACDLSHPPSDPVGAVIDCIPKSIYFDRKSINVDRKSINIDRKSINIDRESINVDQESINAEREPINIDREAIDRGLIRSSTLRTCCSRGPRPVA